MKSLSNAAYLRLVQQRQADNRHENNVADLLKRKAPGAFHAFFDKTRKVQTRKGPKAVPNTRRVSDAPLRQDTPKPLDLPALRKAEAAYKAAAMPKGEISKN